MFDSSKLSLNITPCPFPLTGVFFTPPQESSSDTMQKKANKFHKHDPLIIGFESTANDGNIKLYSYLKL